MSLEIVRAQKQWLPEVRHLLHRVNLPVDGVAEHLDNFLVARDNQDLIGCIGLEIYGDYALLRSLAVAPESQKMGLGKDLTAKILHEAENANVREVVLLTNTAAKFFEQIFSFGPTARSLYDEVFAASPEWQLPCCTSAVCLHLKL